jgi:putative ABC transport system permease protein
MFSTLWRKVLRDMWLYLPRTLLVILAIAIGIFGVGFVLDAYAILTREINTNFTMTNPPSATLWMDNVDTDVVDIARNFPGIADAEAARRAVRGRVQVGPNEWEILRLFARARSWVSTLEPC